MRDIESDLTPGIELDTSDARQSIRRSLPITIGYTHKSAERLATPGDGYFGLHAILRIQQRFQSDETQHPDLHGLEKLISETFSPGKITRQCRPPPANI
jgi:hypothetical protein